MLLISAILPPLSSKSAWFTISLESPRSAEGGHRASTKACFYWSLCWIIKVTVALCCAAFRAYYCQMTFGSINVRWGCYARLISAIPLVFSMDILEVSSFNGLCNTSSAHLLLKSIKKHLDPESPYFKIFSIHFESLSFIYEFWNFLYLAYLSLILNLKKSRTHFS